MYTTFEEKFLVSDKNSDIIFLAFSLRHDYIDKFQFLRMSTNYVRYSTSRSDNENELC